MGKKKKKTTTDPERLRELIEEATVDCYNEEEQYEGVRIMVVDNVVCPFSAKMIGETVEVTALEEARTGRGVMAVCRYKDKDYRIDINSLEWSDDRPEGFEWIEAYFEWQKGGL
jgi:hypothetical protein